jgi:hypothetical protein
MAKPLASKSHPKLFHLEDMEMSPFSAPFFWGAQERGLLLPKRAAALWEGTQWCKGGTGKAEAAKLPDAGISLKQCPEK